MDRRDFLRAGGVLAIGFPAFVRAAAAHPSGRAGPPRPGPIEVLMRADPTGAEVRFDPIGLHIEPGRTVRWVVERHAHTATAYHPRNADSPLRIPEGAEPWDSGYLVNPGDAFEHTFELPGVYDYYCIPHEAAGMVGRIVVGAPAGARAFDEPGDTRTAPDRRAIPAAALTAFPSIDRILREGVVRT